MSIAPDRINELARKWISGSITAEEKEEFMKWYVNADDGQPLDIPKEFVTDELTHGLRMYKNIYKKNLLAEPMAEEPVVPVHRIHFLRTAWFRYAAAIILIVSIAGYFWKNERPQRPVTVQNKSLPVLNDVKPPASAHAVITLSTGRNIILDSIVNGTIINEGDVEVVKLAEGHIAYKGTSDQITYNTLSNPRGSKVVSIVLGDGTKVWLNSESSLRYPTAFTGSERVVEVTGETYFEVAKDKDKPFKVKKDAMEVTVLGTHFNVNTYEEESKMEVTLIEGSVDVISTVRNNSIRLNPGDQSQLFSNGNLTVSKDVNTEDVIAWKNGKFQFGEKSDIGTIMRKLSRWYDVEVEYRGTIKHHFGGSISSNVNLSQVLKVLETTGDVSFKVEGKRVTVMP